MAKLKVNITLDEELLRRIEDYAEENYMNRSSVISLATSQFLNAAEMSSAIKNMSLALRTIADKGEVDPDTLKELEDFERLARLLVGTK